MEVDSGEVNTGHLEMIWSSRMGSEATGLVGQNAFCMGELHSVSHEISAIVTQFTNHWMPASLVWSVSRLSFGIAVTSRLLSEEP